MLQFNNSSSLFYVSIITGLFILSLILTPDISVFPSEKSNEAFAVVSGEQSKQSQIFVESSDYNGLSDTDRIDRAVEDAIESNSKLIFGDRSYNYKGSKYISNVVHWVGTQEEKYNTEKSTIHISGRWTFAGEGGSIIRGIAINGNRSFTGDVVRIHSRVKRIEFNRTHLMGALHQKGTDAAIVLNVDGNAGEVIFNNGTISDAHSTAPIELTSNDGGWRYWPSIRGFNASSGFDGYLEMKDVEIFDIGHEVAYENGDKVWEHPNKGTLNPGGWDIDAWQRSGNEGTGLTVMENVRFYSIPGSYMKVSQHGGTMHFKNLNLHVREREPVAGRLIRFQSHGSGFQRNGSMTGTKIRVDRSVDMTYLGGGSALHMLISFSANRQEETFHVKDTVIEIGLNEENPIYLDDQGIFGYHRTPSSKHGLIIENTIVHVPGGIEWFFRNSTNARDSKTNALNNPNEVTFKNNTDIKKVRRFYYANPYSSSCKEKCEVYTAHVIRLEGQNTMYNLDGKLVEVHSEVSPSAIWRSDSGAFSDCSCEENIDEMYQFIFPENSEN